MKSASGTGKALASVESGVKRSKETIVRSSSSMATQHRFIGRALPLREDDFASACEALHIGAAELWALLQVETRGAGFLDDRRPVILFERHKFSELTDGKFNDSHPEISNPASGGYGGPGKGQYLRLEKAAPLDAQAAFGATSWGLGQIMGYNARRAGFESVDSMVWAMSQGEGMQLAAVVNYLQTSDCARLLSGRNWSAFAARYNGSAYLEHRYDVRIAQAYQRLSQGPLPDLQVREAQLLLIYRGFHPGVVDGLWGKFTASALADFVAQEGLQIAPSLSNLPRLLARLSAGLLH